MTERLLNALAQQLASGKASRGASARGHALAHDRHGRSLRARESVE
jgi:hypothetical protein